MIRIVGIAFLVLCGCLSACGSVDSNPTVQFRVLANGEPLPGAGIRIIPAETNMVGLPVTRETLAEASRVEGGIVVTSNRDGIAKAKLYPEIAYVVEVLPSPFSSWAQEDETGGTGRWSYLLLRGHESLVEGPIGRDNNSPGMSLELVN
ncbi:MAG: hypothetical protein AAGB34_08760 [Planctomycetota bacterium]